MILLVSKEDGETTAEDILEILHILADSASIFGRPSIFYIQRSRQMALSQQEYLSRFMFEQPKLIARNKVRSQGEQIQIVQARASTYASPSIVGAYMNQNGISTVVFNAPRGNGVEGTYLGILQKAQGCAICADPDPVANAFQQLPSICTDHSLPPWSQNLAASTCTPGFRQYFPAKLSVTCSTNQIRYPYPSS